MSWPLPLDEVQLLFSPAGFLVVAALPGDRFRIVATSAQSPEHPDMEVSQRLIDTRGPVTGETVVSEVLWSSRFRVHHRLASAYRGGRGVVGGGGGRGGRPAG